MKPEYALRAIFESHGWLTLNHRQPRLGFALTSQAEVARVKRLLGRCGIESIAPATGGYFVLLRGIRDVYRYRDRIGIESEEKSQQLNRLLAVREGVKRSRSWRPEEIKFLEDNYSVMTARQLAEALNMSLGGVRYQVTQLGLTKRWSDPEVDLLKSHIDWPKADIANHLGRTRKAVYRKTDELRRSGQLPRKDTG